MVCFKCYRKFMFAGIGCLLAFTVGAQTRTNISVQEWPRAKVTLSDGQVLSGPLTFFRDQETISVQNNDGSVTTLSPVNVDYFEVSDESDTRSHLFRTIYWDQGRAASDFKKPTFFEQLTSGKTVLLMQESYFYKRNDANILGSGNFYDPMGYPLHASQADQIKPKFYLLTPEGNIAQLRNVRKDFLRFCGDKAEAIKAYAKEQQLNYELPHELAALVIYYNTL
jgi:hypothetical protein